MIDVCFNIYEQEFCFKCILIIDAIVCTIDRSTGCSVQPFDLECINFIFKYEMPFPVSQTIERKKNKKLTGKRKAIESDLK